MSIPWVFSTPYCRRTADFRQVLSRDSILLWFFQTYWRRRRELPVFLDGLAARGVLIQRLRSPTDLEAWLARFPSPLAQVSGKCQSNAW
ncbi:hypothetical protein [Chitinimonas sp. BJB300]|uniref:hypothetical protein n=1 Tax=Chitinimonas sp. BJB300 TaxID=1559339 RepID=UPI000C102F89|nr:hypothetical protein [Chitinimonas sp. BJB300]PHV12202.1 hypothetical protein CSQ89_07055 [Chitinimonas sp. BJB300]TSJ91607.1 hypothetical protein FG002_004900 [Chitinimonas sp. BJB300]